MRTASWYRSFAFAALLSLSLPGCIMTVEAQTGTAYSEVSVKTAPPTKQVEVKPTSPGNDYVWIEGHYVYVQSKNKWRWVPGKWAQSRPGYVWVYPSYETRDGQSVYVEGGWVAEKEVRPAGYTSGSNSSGYGSASGSNTNTTGSTGYGSASGSNTGSTGYGSGSSATGTNSGGTTGYGSGSTPKCADGMVWKDGKCAPQTSSTNTGGTSGGYGSAAGSSAGTGSTGYGSAAGSNQKCPTDQIWQDGKCVKPPTGYGSAAGSNTVAIGETGSTKGSGTGSTGYGSGSTAGSATGTGTGSTGYGSGSTAGTTAGSATGTGTGATGYGSAAGSTTKCAANQIWKDGKCVAAPTGYTGAAGSSTAAPANTGAGYGAASGNTSTGGSTGYGAAAGNTSTGSATGYGAASGNTSTGGSTGYGAAASAPTNEPPKPKYEKPSKAPSAEHVWVSGRWKWEGGSYVWVMGEWVKKPGFEWIPGKWIKKDNIWVYEDGQWKKK